MYDFYELLSLSEILKLGLGPSVLIASPNAEERSVSAMEHLITAGELKNLLLCSQPSANKYAKIAFEKVTCGLNYRGVVFENIPLVDPELDAASETLLEKIISIQCDGESLAIDMTGFDRRMLFLLLKKLKDRAHIMRLDVIYTEPLQYAPVLSSGVGVVSSFEGFGGRLRMGRDTLLVIQLGFEGQRALAVYNYYEDSVVIPIVAFPAYRPGWVERTLIENKRVLEQTAMEADCSYSPANDPFETANVIIRIRQKYPNSDTVLSPLGTKPQALGACLVGLSDSSMRIADAPPASLDGNITSGSGESWVYRIDISKPEGPYQP